MLNYQHTDQDIQQLLLNCQIFKMRYLERYLSYCNLVKCAYRLVTVAIRADVSCIYRKSNSFDGILKYMKKHKNIGYRWVY